MHEEIELFDQKIDIKNCICTHEGDSPVTSHLMLDLYIQITDLCNATCDFCCNKGNHKKSKIDYEKLKFVIKYLDEKNLINRIAITGGEPFLDMNRLNNVINTIYEAKEDACVTINTNGFRINRVLKLDNFSKLEGIYISRHHYNDIINDRIFGIETPSVEDIYRVTSKCKNPTLFMLNCLLMKSYISNLKEVKKYLEMASDLGIYKCRFISPMPCNKESIKEFVDYNTIFNNLPSEFQITSSLNDYDICECKNGVYLASNGNIVPFSARMTSKPNCPYARQFVYTSDNRLTAGFNNKTIY